MARIRVIVIGYCMILEKLNNRISWNVEEKKEEQQMKPERVNAYSENQIEVFEAQSYEQILWKAMFSELWFLRIDGHCPIRGR